MGGVCLLELTINNIPVLLGMIDLQIYSAYHHKK